MFVLACKKEQHADSKVIAIKNDVENQAEENHHEPEKCSNWRYRWCHTGLSFLYSISTLTGAIYTDGRRLVLYFQRRRKSWNISRPSTNGTNKVRNVEGEERQVDEDEGGERGNE